MAVFSRGHGVLAVLLGWSCLAWLSLHGHNEFHVLNIAGALYLALVPGYLVLCLLRLRGLSMFAQTAMSLALSLLLLICVGLLGNQILPLIGILEPLSQHILILELTVMILVLSFGAYSAPESVPEAEAEAETETAAISIPLSIGLAVLPLLFALQATVGAISINNGGTNLITFWLLPEIAAYSILLIAYRARVSESTIPFALSGIGLSLLLMTSLRGWYVTGHDIQQEYRVFMLAKEAALWNIQTYVDAYNACMSITILPTIFAKLLVIPDAYLYKILFQFFFAITPGIVYMFTRLWMNRFSSLAASMFFVSFPTFFADMPFLIRQEIAFIYFGLMVYVLFLPAISITRRRLLFLIFSLGLVLSHYSTTYTVIFTFAFAVFAGPPFMYIVDKLKKTPLLRNSSLVLAVEEPGSRRRGRMTLFMLACILAVSFLWTGIITHTSTSVTSVVDQTMAAIRSGFGESARSVDALSLIMFGQPSQNTALSEYVDTWIVNERAKVPAGIYVSDETFKGYTFEVAVKEKTPLTPLGTYLNAHHIPIDKLTSLFGQLLAKLLQILPIIALVFVFFRNSLHKKVDQELYLLAVGCVIFLGLNIVIPVLSTEYGIFRALQQSLFILGYFTVLGCTLMNLTWQRWASAIISRVLKRPVSQPTRGSQQIFTVTIVLAFFLYATSFIPYIAGNTTAALHLENSGGYYDEFLIKTPSVIAAEWMKEQARMASTTENNGYVPVQTDRSMQRVFDYVAPSLEITTTIFPGLISKNAYVVLPQSVFERKRAAIFYNGDRIAYIYPLDALDAQKNLIYSNGAVEIYR